MQSSNKAIVSTALTMLLFYSAPAFCDDRGKLVGTWKLISSYIEDAENKARDNIEGESVEGYLRFAATGQFFGFATTSIDKLPDQRGANSISRALVAYCGNYPLDGSNFSTRIDLVWDEDWLHAEQVRFYRLDSDRQLVETFSIQYPNAFGSIMIGVRIWARE